MGKEVIIACDFNNADTLYAFLDRFTEEKPFLKIGMELFYAEGPGIVKEAKKRGHKVFLDLKLHDIPNTVKKAMAVLSGLGADMVNCHAAGGRAMMEAALEGLSKGGGERPKLIAVTQLTSTDRTVLKNELLIEKSMEETVISYASNAKAAGLDGVVCSALEAGRVHEALGDRFLTVTPGIRFRDGDAGDQKRVVTPDEAKDLGSDYIVVGRPVTASPDPAETYRKCAALFSG